MLRLVVTALYGVSLSCSAHIQVRSFSNNIQKGHQVYSILYYTILYSAISAAQKKYLPHIFLVVT